MNITYRRRIFTSLFIVGLLVFVAPSTTYAAWWNPFSWFTKTETIQETLPQYDAQATDTPAVSPEATGTAPIGEVPAPVITQQRVVTPAIGNSQDAKAIVSLQEEVASLKASLDTLRASHNDLVNDHNKLLEYTKSIAAQKQSATVVQQADTSAIERRIAELERKAKMVSDELYGNGKTNDVETTLRNICTWTFGSSVLSGCPSTNPNGIGSIDSRLEKLERGY